MTSNNIIKTTELNLKDFDENVFSQIKKVDGKNICYFDQTDITKYKMLKFEIKKEKKLSVLYKFKDNLGKQGYQVFCPNVDSNDASAYTHICILKSNDKYDILRALKTNGINYELETNNIIDKLSQWDNKYGIDIIGAGFDWVEFQFKNPDEEVLPKEIYEFCPDCIDQCLGDIELLEFALENCMEIFLWWD